MLFRNTSNVINEPAHLFIDKLENFIKTLAFNSNFSKFRILCEVTACISLRSVRMHATLLNNQSPSDILLYFYSEIFLKTILKEKLSVKAGQCVD